MNNQIKTSIIWGLIALSLVMHSTMEIGEALFFKPLPNTSEPKEFSAIIHVIYLTAMIIPMLMSFLTLFYNHKVFKIFSLVYASLLILLNFSHLIETVMGNIGNISQVILLSFIVIFNVTLVVILNKWLKEKTN